MRRMWDIFLDLNVCSGWTQFFYVSLDKKISSSVKHHGFVYDVVNFFVHWNRISAKTSRFRALRVCRHFTNAILIEHSSRSFKPQSNATKSVWVFMTVYEFACVCKSDYEKVTHLIGAYMSFIRFVARIYENKKFFPFRKIPSEMRVGECVCMCTFAWCICWFELLYM